MVDFMDSLYPNMTSAEVEAFEWALSCDFPSAACEHAKTLALYIKRAAELKDHLFGYLGLEARERLLAGTWVETEHDAARRNAEGGISWTAEERGVARREWAERWGRHVAERSERPDDTATDDGR
jgi:hypothetical protein